MEIRLKYGNWYFVWIVEYVFFINCCFFLICKYFIINNEIKVLFVNMEKDVIGLYDMNDENWRSNVVVNVVVKDLV